LGLFAGGVFAIIALMRAILFSTDKNSSWIRLKNWTFLLKYPIIGSNSR